MTCVILFQFFFSDIMQDNFDIQFIFIYGLRPLLYRIVMLAVYFFVSIK